MVKLDNRGFTLVEVLAVIVILGILSTILIFSVTNLLKNGEDNNYDHLESSIISAAKIYMSDNRYDVLLGEDTCTNNNSYRDVKKVGVIEINSKLSVKVLVDNHLLSTNEIVNPKSKNQKLDLVNSYVYVKYNCNTRDYVYGCFDDDNDCFDTWKSKLKWNS